MLTYLNRELTKKERRTVIRYMTQYRNLDAIIESKKMDMNPSHTQVIEDKPSQSVRAFHSECEDYAIQADEIKEYEHVKRKLDLAYKSVNSKQRIIWDERFIDGRNDTDVHYKHEISRRTYYREKKELLHVVASCLGVGTMKAQ